jgi:hypothetical protein
MTDVFARLLDLSQLDKFPSKIAKFVHPSTGHGFEISSWEYISFGYSEAFENLARAALAKTTSATWLARCFTSPDIRSNWP